MNNSIEKNASNQSGGSFSSTTTTARIKKVTSIVREFNAEGVLFRETETVTEYEEKATPYYSPYQPQPFATY